MKLRRITTHGNWIPEIDGLRFVAISATLLAHILAETVLRGGQTFPASVQPVFTGLMYRGGRGVPLFFAISGFILAQPFLRQHLLHGPPASVKAFYMRRLTRLEPPYILSLLIYGAVLAIHHDPRSLILPLLAHIAYLHSFFPLKTINFVTWSLEVEVQFYILAPVLGYLFAIPSTIKRRGVMVFLLLASAIFQYSSHSVLSGSLPGQLQFFLAGFLLADLRAFQVESAVGLRWDLASLIAWITIFGLPVGYIPFTLPAFILLACFSTFKGPISRKIFRTPWIALTGGMCYSFYLMHMLVISAALKYTRRFILPSNMLLSFLIQLALIGPCIYAFCTAYYVFIERPCMDPNWFRKLMARLSRRLRTNNQIPTPESR
jgi:peptidoglycan/LPS O-acetylase OafA/YrhL